MSIQPYPRPSPLIDAVVHSVVLSGMARVVVVIATALLTIFLLSDTSVAATTRATIRLVNNGYEGLLVAIAETVPADQSSKVITRIKVGPTQSVTLCFTRGYSLGQTSVQRRKLMWLRYNGRV